jgi:hypothetical protein
VSTIPYYGLMTKRDDTVEVGADLCVIDTEAEATVEAPKSSLATEKSSAVEAPPADPPIAPVVVGTSQLAAAPATSTQHGARTPSIQFLGKEGWARVLSGNSLNVVYSIPANYGRLGFSEEEMEALIMGGANLAPEVKDYSSGATFKM